MSPETNRRAKIFERVSLALGLGFIALVFFAPDTAQDMFEAIGEFVAGSTTFLHNQDIDSSVQGTVPNKEALS